MSQVPFAMVLTFLEPISTVRLSTWVIAALPYGFSTFYIAGARSSRLARPWVLREVHEHAPAMDALGRAECCLCSA